jgi:hypothetical protein
MVPEPRSWIQFSPATQFSAARIPPSLASAGSAGTAAPEREQTAPTAVTHAGEGMLDYSIRGPLALPYHLGFMVGLVEEGPLAPTNNV